MQGPLLPEILRSVSDKSTGFRLLRLTSSPHRSPPPSWPTLAAISPELRSFAGEERVLGMGRFKRAGLIEGGFQCSYLDDHQMILTVDGFSYITSSKIVILANLSSFFKIFIFWKFFYFCLNSPSKMGNFGCIPLNKIFC